MQNEEGTACFVMRHLSECMKKLAKTTLWPPTSQHADEKDS